MSVFGWLNDQLLRMTWLNDLVGAGVALIPVPGVDWVTDVGILLKLIPDINRAFGLTEAQAAGIHRRKGIRHSARAAVQSKQGICHSRYLCHIYRILCDISCMSQYI